MKSLPHACHMKQGYNVISVEDENKGWDLEATKGKAFLCIEVKGLAGSQISVHISKNESSKMNPLAELI